MGKISKSKRKVLTDRFDTGILAKELFSLMADDFRSEGFLMTDRPLTWLRCNNLVAFRQWEYIEGMNMPPKYLKMARQMNNLLAKYTFQNDAIDSKQREKDTIEGWLLDAARIAKYAQLDVYTESILREARGIVKRILGDLPDFNTIASFGRFGTRATRGCSLSHAGLDVYCTDPAAFTSSSQCLRWVTDVLLPGDALLDSLLSKCITPETVGIESIVLNLVPKKWSKDRPITPLQLTDLLYSYAWGKYVEIRLELVGLNIQKLQDRHRKIVRRQSVLKTYATVDLSGGSNNITKQHMLLLCPRPWFRTFKRCLTHKIIVMDEKIEKGVWTPSVLPMGNALTFPLETLFFYAVAEAVRLKVGCRGFVSCYGDDLIYPSRIHDAVVHTFKRLNWAMNLTKTYVSHSFRESCGEDYYHGVAVRPFFFPDVRPLVGRMAFRRLLYQIYNGLLERWDEKTISRTLRYLLVRIAQLGDVYRVPPSYPEYAGIRCLRPWAKTDWTIPYAKIYCEWCPDIQNFRFSFCCLSEKAKMRPAKSSTPIYWDTLRQSESLELLNTLRGKPAFDPLAYLSRSEKSLLKWNGFKRQVKKHGKIVRKYIAWKLYLPSKKTRSEDILTQTCYWSDVDSWCGTTGYQPVAAPQI